ncbi:MAG: HDOD domain-containing protein [Verrucomicrobiota bacterium]
MKIEDIIKDIDSISPALQILPQLMDLLRDDNATLDDIIALIKLDASLSAQVLKICNSGYYGLTTGSLEAAVNRLGQREVYKIVATICGKESLNKPVEQFSINDGELWENSVATGLVMESLAKRLDLEAETAYTVGLLHSMGKLIINEKVQGAYEHVYEIQNKRSLTIIEAEESVLGFNHAQLAGKLLESWSFPEEIYIPVAHQYSPENADTHTAIAHLIYLANFVIANIGLNYGRDAWAVFGSQEALDYFKFDDAEMQELILEAHDIVQEVKGSLIPNRKAAAPEV